MQIDRVAEGVDQYGAEGLTSGEIWNSSTSTRPGLLKNIRQLRKFRDLQVAWFIRDLRVRYKQTLLGALWAILQPLALMVLFAIVFSIFVQVPSDDIPYPIFVYTALVPWTFFATAVTLGTPSLVNNMTLVTKIYFPREILPFASIGVTLVDFAIAFTVLFVMMFVYRVPLNLTLLWIPILVILQLILTAGVVLFASASNAFYRDIRFLVPLALQLWMFATPIIYPISAVPERIRPLYMLNPMAVIVEGYRQTILKGESPDLAPMAVAFVVASFLLVAGYSYFKRVEIVLPDVI